VGFKPYLKDKLVSFSALTLVGLVIRPVKIVPEMTYNVLSGTLSLYTTTTHKTVQPSGNCQTDVATSELWLM